MICCGGVYQLQSLLPNAKQQPPNQTRKERTNKRLSSDRKASKATQHLTYREPSTPGPLHIHPAPPRTPRPWREHSSPHPFPCPGLELHSRSPPILLSKASQDLHPTQLR